MPPLQTFTGPTMGAPDEEFTVTLMKLSTNTFPVPSIDDDRDAAIGVLEQLRLRVALLNITALVPKPVPFAELRTLTGSKIFIGV